MAAGAIAVKSIGNMSGSDIQMARRLFYELEKVLVNHHISSAEIGLHNADGSFVQTISMPASRGCGDGENYCP